MIAKRIYDKFSFGLFLTGGFCFEIAFGWVGFTYYFNMVHPFETLPQMSEKQLKEPDSEPKNE